MQAITEISVVDDFENIVNNMKDNYFKQIEESLENNKKDLQTLDDALKMFDEKQRTLDEVAINVFMHAMSLGDVETNANLKQAIEHQNAFRNSINTLKEKKAGVLQEEKDFHELEKCIQVQHELLQQQVLLARIKLHKGLTPERIQKFRKFEADELMVGDQCSICLNEFEVGREMMQLDCDGQHNFCQQCVESWFADHNTCPVCREKFEN